MDIGFFDLVAYWLLCCAAIYLFAVVGMAITDFISRLLGWI